MKNSFELKDFNNCPVMRFSSIREISSKKMVYKVKAPYTDTYNINTKNVEEYLLCDEKGNVVTNLIKNNIYFLTITPTNLNELVEFNVEASSNKAVLPYESIFKYNANDFNVNDNETDPLKPAVVSYVKNPNGTYINVNNPETLHEHYLNKAFCRDTLLGDVFFTFEHNNLLLENTYYGYMVKNTNKHNIYITVKNIGYHDQGAGSWLGQNEWIQFYNTDFKWSTDEYNETEMKTFLDEYNFDRSLKPDFNQPITYCLPPNEEMFIMGGTTDIAYNNYNVFNTANRSVSKTCSNGAVYFEVVGGEAEGTFYVYNDSSKINKKDVQGYVTGEYNHPFGHPENAGVQYCGSDKCNGLVEADLVWEFNDKTEPQLLPVTFKNFYSDNAPEKGTPFGKIPGVVEHTQNRTDWVTHLNPQNNTAAVGTDMTFYNTIDASKKSITIQPGYYDGLGSIANIGNWMVGYQNRYTLVNKGSKSRKVTIIYNDNGSTAVLIRDKDGKVIDAVYTMSKVKRVPYSYTVEVEANSVLQFTFEYNLLANSYGNVVHSVKLD